MLRTLAERAVVEEGGKVLPGFKFLSQAEAAARLAARRAEVHAKWVKMWAKRVMVNPEQAVVPLKERDALLASRHQVRRAALGVRGYQGRYGALRTIGAGANREHGSPF